MNKITHVAVGVIYNSNKNEVLITKRTAKQHLAGFWEFPGGKLEANEDARTALSRELHEELGITVNNAEQLIVVDYDYPDEKVLLDVWNIFDWSGEPSSRENQEIAWSKIHELNTYKFPEANKRIIQTILLSPYYVISQEHNDDSWALLSIADECFSSGLKLFQLRLKSRKDCDFSELIQKLNESAKTYNAKLILNGVPSDVEAYKVDGLHLKARELIKHENRPISEEFILGASCHNEKELAQAEKLNVNYAFISPVYPTTSHSESMAIG